jgi:hypothetical protein
VSTAIAAAVIVAAFALVPLSALKGPGGPIPPLLPRTWRKAWRDWRGPRSGQASGRVPRWLAERCKAADRHRCVACGRASDLEADHVIPWIVGGATVLWNLVTLCRACNAIKSCYWVSPSGKIYYRGSRVQAAVAAEILAWEKRARRNPLRWARAYRLLP